MGNKIINIQHDVWEQLKHLTIHKNKGSISDLLEEILKENNLWDEWKEKKENEKKTGKLIHHLK